MKRHRIEAFSRGAESAVLADGTLRIASGMGNVTTPVAPPRIATDTVRSCYMAAMLLCLPGWPYLEALRQAMAAARSYHRAASCLAARLEDAAEPDRCAVAHSHAAALLADYRALEAHRDALSPGPVLHPTGYMMPYFPGNTTGKLDGLMELDELDPALHDLPSGTVLINDRGWTIQIVGNKHHRAGHVWVWHGNQPENFAHTHEAWLDLEHAHITSTHLHPMEVVELPPWTFDLGDCEEEEFVPEAMRRYHARQHGVGSNLAEGWL